MFLGPPRTGPSPGQRAARSSQLSWSHRCGVRYRAGPASDRARWSASAPSPAASCGWPPPGRYRLHPAAPSGSCSQSRKGGGKNRHCKIIYTPSDSFSQTREMREAKAAGTVQQGPTIALARLTKNSQTH